MRAEPDVRTSETALDAPLTDYLPDGAPLAWIHRGDGLVGIGEAEVFAPPPGPGRFAAMQEHLVRFAASRTVHDEIALPGTGPVAFASATFAADAAGSVMVIPRTVIGRRDGRSWVTTTTPGAPAPRARPRPPSPPGAMRPTGDSLPRPRWVRAAERALRALESGELDKVVLSRHQELAAERPIDQAALLAALTGTFPECFAFACAGLVGATPELLLRVTGRRVTSLVLAGTAGRAPSPDDDARLAAELHASEKARREHRYAVDSVLDALGDHTGTLEVGRPRILRLANVQHLATEITGERKAQAALSDLLSALHPTAAVGGTPPEAALRMIRALEPSGRGRYAGPVGWMDAAGNGEWGIALRCAEIDGRTARVYAGSGLVAGSDPGAEFEESELKLGAVRGLLAAPEPTGEEAVPQQMRGMVIERFGGPDVLTSARLPVPVPGPGEVLIRVRAVGVGRTLDLETRAGRLPFARQIRMPHLLGAEHVGVVAATGPGTTGLRVGRRVAVFPVIACGSCRACLDDRTEACADLKLIGVHRPGAYASYSCVPAANVFPVPDDVDDATACALALNGAVARRQLDTAEVGEGTTVLVQAAGGALGTATVAAALFRRARVIACTRRSWKRDRLRALGVQLALDPAADDFHDRVRRLAGPGGVDVVIDNLAEPGLWERSLEVLGTGGRVVCSGALVTGRVPLDLRTTYLRNQQVIGVRTARVSDAEQVWRDTGDGLGAIADDGREFTLEQAAQAHRYVADNGNFGRVVLDVATGSDD